MTALVLKNAETVVVAVDADAAAAKLQLIESALEITSIEDGFTLEIAAKVGSRLRGMQFDIEKARKDIKAPVLDLGRKIDSLAQDFGADIARELGRLTGLINAYTAAERRKAEAAERARQAELRRIEEEKRQAAEAERIAAEARAKAVRDQDAAFTREQEEQARKEREAREAEQRQEQERQRQLAAEKAKLQTAPVATVAKPSGVAHSKVWRFEVTDIHALYAHDAALVTVEPKAGAINTAIRGGLRECPGLRIWQEDSTVIRR